MSLSLFVRSACIIFLQSPKRAGRLSFTSPHCKLFNEKPLIGYTACVKIFYLLKPKFQSVWNHVRSRPKLPGVVIVSLTIAFLVALHYLVLEMLKLMDQVPLIGLVLKNYLLSAVLLCLLFMLVFSNLINALSAFFLSRELDLVFSSPAPFSTIFISKFSEVMLRSSWMVVLLLAPVMSAYTVSYKGDSLFYLLWLPLTVPYMILCAALGVTLALVLAVVLPVQRAATVLRFVFVVGVGIVIVLLRVLQPEQLMVPERFESFGRFLLTLHSPFANSLPSYWLSRVMICVMTFDFFAFDRFIWPYLLSSLLSFCCCYLLARSLYLKGWRRMRMGAAGKRGVEDKSVEDKDGFWRRSLTTMANIFGIRKAATLRLIEKEICIFTRTPAIWTQTALLGVIVIIYVYNIHLLPAESLANLRADLPSITAFFNVAFIGFIITAAALRFGFPLISMEGRALFLIMASPIKRETYLSIKFWCSAFPLAILGVILAAASCYMLETTVLVTSVIAIDVCLLAMGISALALLFGTVYADLRAHNFAEIPSGWGGMLFMTVATVYIAIFLACQAYPCYIHFLGTTSLYKVTRSDLIVTVAFLTLSLCTAGVTTHLCRSYCERCLKSLV